MKKLYIFIAVCFNLNLVAQDYECATKDYDETNIHTFLKSFKQINQSPDFTGKFPIVNIPVQIHLFKTSAGVATITLPQIRAEITAANVKYANAGLKLVECLAPEIIQDDALYNYNISQEGYVLANHYTNNLINLYFPNKINVTSTSTVCGYAQMPPNADYVFIAASCATNGSTFAHELGHYFGLPHTHSKWQNVGELVNGSNCTNAGDKFCDTPADPDLTNRVNSSCVYTGTVKDANNQSYIPNTHMMMSYSVIACRNVFSSQQYAMMNTIYLNYRNYLNCGTTSIIATDETTNIDIYPNPANNSFSISLAENDRANIKVFTIEGKEVYSKNTLAKGDLIDVSAFNSGYYFVQIQHKDKLVSKPLVILNK